ncbi:MAG: hypothetical protein HGA85_05590 [Nanoarchaeota archaeon]|nr:hypothetical protein [Nanoarchaeota archaeon]
MTIYAAIVHYGSLNPKHFSEFFDAGLNLVVGADEATIHKVTRASSIMKQEQVAYGKTFAALFDECRQPVYGFGIGRIHTEPRYLLLTPNIEETTAACHDAFKNGSLDFLLRYLPK